MFLSVRLCAEPMTQLCRLKVKVTLQGYVIYSSVCVYSISPEPFEQFSLKYHLNVLFVYRTHDSAMQTQSQGHTSCSWDSGGGGGGGGGNGCPSDCCLVIFNLTF